MYRHGCTHARMQVLVGGAALECKIEQLLSWTVERRWRSFAMDALVRLIIDNEEVDVMNYNSTQFWLVETS